MPDKPQKQSKKKNSRRSLVSHTKGYYRFSKNYPGDTDENGYRDNNSARSQPLTGQGRAMLTVGIVLCFVCAFLLTSIALRLSNRVPETTTLPRATEEELPIVFTTAAPQTEPETLPDLTEPLTTPTTTQPHTQAPTQPTDISTTKAP